MKFTKKMSTNAGLTHFGHLRWHNTKINGSVYLTHYCWHLLECRISALSDGPFHQLRMISLLKLGFKFQSGLFRGW